MREEGEEVKCNPSITVSIEPTQEFRDVLKGAVDGLQPIADRIDALERDRDNAGIVWKRAVPALSARVEALEDLHTPEGASHGHFLKPPAAHKAACCDWWAGASEDIHEIRFHDRRFGMAFPPRFCPNCGARKEAK
jgi:hypothetical protein